MENQQPQPMEEPVSAAVSLSEVPDLEAQDSAIPVKDVKSICDEFVIATGLTDAARSYSDENEEAACGSDLQTNRKDKGDQFKALLKHLQTEAPVVNNTPQEVREPVEQDTEDTLASSSEPRYEPHQAFSIGPSCCAD